LSITGLFFIGKLLPESQTVIIDADGKPAYILPLDEDRTISIEGPEGKTIVVIQSKKVCISDSPCPNRLCIKQGWIDRGALVCLPNNVIVTIQGHRGNDRGIDAVTR
jgi:hypothetical protein